MLPQLFSTHHRLQRLHDKEILFAWKQSFAGTIDLVTILYTQYTTYIHMQKDKSTKLMKKQKTENTKYRTK